MTKVVRITAATCAASLCVAFVGPVTGADASKASIKATIKSYSTSVLKSEANVVSALAEYKTSKNAVPAQTALGEAVTVLRALRAKVAAQPARRPRVKEAKIKILEGLHAIVVSYTSLSTALGEKASDPAAADSEAEKFLAAAKKGIKELHQGVLLLAT